MHCLESRISELVEKSVTREDVRHIGEKITGISERVAWLEGRLELPVNSPDAGSMVNVGDVVSQFQPTTCLNRMSMRRRLQPMIQRRFEKRFFPICRGSSPWRRREAVQSCSCRALQAQWAWPISGLSGNGGS